MIMQSICEMVSNEPITHHMRFPSVERIETKGYYHQDWKGLFDYMPKGSGVNNMIDLENLVEYSIIFNVPIDPIFFKNLDVEPEKFINRILLRNSVKHTICPNIG